MTSTNQVFVEVTGSYDAVHVGPFETAAAAQRWVGENRRGQFDFAVMTDAERRAANAEFGELPIQAPSCSLDDDA